MRHLSTSEIPIVFVKWPSQFRYEKVERNEASVTDSFDAFAFLRNNVGRHNTPSYKLAPDPEIDE